MAQLRPNPTFPGKDDITQPPLDPSRKNGRYPARQSPAHSHWKKYSGEREGLAPRSAAPTIDSRPASRHDALMIQTLLQVALGGAIGASGRYLVGLGAVRVMGPGFPWGTLVVNILGSFVMGVIVVLLGHLSANRFAPLLMTGVLGGFTTFSAFSLDAVTLWERGATGQSVAYVAVSVLASITALLAGLMLARTLAGGAA